MKRLGDVIRQHGGEICPHDAGLVAGLHLAGTGGGFASEEIAQKLRGGRIGAARQIEGGLFKAALHRDSGQHVVSHKVLRPHIDHETGIRIRLGAGVAAHAIGDDGARFGIRRHHEAAGTHAEAVGGATGAAVSHEFIRRGAETLMTGPAAVKRAVDELLRMLDAHADGEGLPFHRHAMTMEHLEGISRAVSDAEDDPAAFDRAAIGQHHTAHDAVLDDHIAHLGLKAHLAAQFDDLLTDVAHHFDETIRADVWACFDEDVLGCTGFDHLLQQPGDAVLAVADLGVELSIGECARAAFAKLHVRFGIEGPATVPKAGHIAGTITRGLATFEQYGLPSGSGKHQAAKQAAGACADDDGTVRDGMSRAGDFILFRFRDLHTRGFVEPLKHAGLVIDFRQQRVTKAYMTAPGVDGALLDLKMLQMVRFDLQRLQRRLTKGGVGVIDGKQNLAELEHAGRCS